MIGLVLLLAASDLFTDWSAWHAGLRGLPTQLAIVEIESDSCLRLQTDAANGVSDMVRNLPRPLTLAERPFMQAHVWLPDFATWPTGDQNYAGFRLTITDQYQRFVWPGIYLARSAGVPCFTTRVLADNFGRFISEPGFWTLGIGFDAAGALSFYAKPGKAALSAADIFFTDTTGWTYMQTVEGWFLQVTTPSAPWYVGSVSAFADIHPSLALELNLDGGLNINVTGGYPTEPYQIERSTDLLSWQVFAGLTDSIAEPQQFYRVAP